MFSRLSRLARAVRPLGGHKMQSEQCSTLATSCLPLKSAAPRCAVGFMSLSRRWTHSEQVIPLKPGAVPQYVIKCHGTHRQGLVKDVSTIIASRGASVAALQKVGLGTEYVMLMHVYSVDGGGYDEVLATDLRRAIGMSSSVHIGPLDNASRKMYETTESSWQLVIECPQRPGLVFEMATALADYGAMLPKIETRTVTRDGTVFFRLTGIVEALASRDAQALRTKLEAMHPTADVLLEETTNAMVFE